MDNRDNPKERDRRPLSELADMFDNQAAPPGDHEGPAHPPVQFVPHVPFDGRSEACIPAAMYEGPYKDQLPDFARYVFEIDEASSIGSHAVLAYTDEEGNMHFLSRDELITQLPPIPAHENARRLIVLALRHYQDALKRSAKDFESMARRFPNTQHYKDAALGHRKGVAECEAVIRQLKALDPHGT